jgi:hypothetical protein
VESAASKVLATVQPPPDLAAALERARTTHARGLVAFKFPLVAADRREYQLYVHVLMSAAMLTERVPVLPLARCMQTGEWGERSRCVYVLHAADGQTWCVMRPPSPCHGKVELPNALEGVGDDDVATATLPRLPLINGSVDVRGFGAALGRGGEQARSRRVLLLDLSDLRSPDDVGNLLYTPKGWLCTLEHKSCQNAC